MISVKCGGIVLNTALLIIIFGYIFDKLNTEFFIKLVIVKIVSSDN